MVKYHEPIPQFKPIAYPKGDVMQFFGENPSLYQACCNLEAHSGWDIVRSWGTPILCVQKGKVVDVKEDEGGNGKHVRVLCQDNEWIYGHMSSITVTLGQQIEAGEEIGKMGNTGFVTSDPTPYWKYNPYSGTHLHLTRYPCDSTKGVYNRFYPSGDKTYILNQDNGYRGAADFNAGDFDIAVTTPVATLKASEQVALFAAKKQAEGNTVQAAQLFALVQFLKVFGY